MESRRRAKDEGQRAKGEGKKKISFSLFPFPFSLPSLLALIPLLICLLAAPAYSASYTQDLNDFINFEVKPLVNTDIVVDSLTKQNEQHASLSESALRVLDNSWHSELRKTNQSLISQVMDNDLSKFLMKIKDAGQGVYTEITIIDSKGLNISQTSVSGSYWNVGKPRWDKTFGVKSYAPYISDIYYSDETNKFQVEISFMIISDEQPIGIIAAGIDVEQLEDWKKRRK